MPGGPVGLLPATAVRPNTVVRRSRAVLDTNQRASAGTRFTLSGRATCRTGNVELLQRGRCSDEWAGRENTSAHARSTAGKNVHVRDCCPRGHGHKLDEIERCSRHWWTALWPAATKGPERRTHRPRRVLLVPCSVSLLGALQVLVQHRRQRLPELAEQTAVGEQVVDESRGLVPHPEQRLGERLR